ncbi:MAG: hypothetical protein WBC72_09820 [Pseudolabrys sp.]
MSATASSSLPIPSRSKDAYPLRAIYDSVIQAIPDDGVGPAQRIGAAGCFSQWPAIYVAGFAGFELRAFASK